MFFNFIPFLADINFRYNCFTCFHVPCVFRTLRVLRILRALHVLPTVWVKLMNSKE